MLLGLNSRMTEFNAALALAGLDLVPGKVARHNRIAGQYTAALEGTQGIGFQRLPPGHRSSYKDYSVTVDPEVFGMTRDELAAALLRENIETKKYFYPPLHQQTFFRPFAPAGAASLPVTEAVTGSVLSLPIYESLPAGTVRQVASAIRELSQSVRPQGARTC